jgi:hypothetical protein
MNRPAKPSTLREEKLLRNIWRASRNLIQSWERLKSKAAADPETYSQAYDGLAYHVPKCRAEMRRIEKILPDLRQIKASTKT